MADDRIPRIVLGLAAALGLAVLAAHPRVKAIERRLGVTVLISAGVPFLAMGAIFAQSSVGILTPDILNDLQPAFEFGLGWIGFVVGMQFDVRRLDRLHPSLGGVVAIESLVPLITTAGLCSMAFVGLGVPWKNVDFLRDALVLAGCAAPSAPLAVELWRERVGRKAADLLHEITLLDEVTVFVALGIVAVFFRPEASATRWVLPPSAWLLVTLGLGGVLGIVTYVLIRGAHSEAEELALLLGAIALSAGMAGYLALSVPVVCAIAGALLANLPLRDAEGLRKTLVDVERPIYLIFLVIVGASWRPTEWQGWVIAVAFVIARTAGKRLGAIWSRRFGPPELPGARAMALALTPQSPMGIVAMVSAAMLYHGHHPDRVRWCLNAVIIGGVLTEIVVRLLEWYYAGSPLATPLPKTAAQRKLPAPGEEDAP
jgi:Kef-type K+ transport system membrane component KefB